MAFVDFSTLVRQECCKENSGPHHFALSTYTQTVFEGDPGRDHCGCRGFSFRRDCKHIREARELAAKEDSCWTEGGELTQTVQQENDMICPKCGGPTRMAKIP